MPTQNEWTLNIGQRVFKELPSNTLAESMSLASAWLVSDGGGWNGTTGAPNSGSTDTQVVNAIVTGELDKVRKTEFTFKIQVKGQVVGSFADGTSDEDIKDAIGELLEFRAQSLFNKDGISIENYDWDSWTADTNDVGTLNQAAKQAVQAEIIGGQPYSSPEAIATKKARDEYSLSNTWVSTSVYVRGNTLADPIIVKVRNHDSSSYGAVTGTISYIVALNKSTNEVITITKVQND